MPLTATNESQVVVIDSGSGKIKAGFAGDSTPMTIFPNIIGKVLEGPKQGCYIGQEAYKMRDYQKIMKREVPLITGDMQSKEDLEKVWQHAF